jgi:hypothetical protein
MSFINRKGFYGLLISNLALALLIIYTKRFYTVFLFDIAIAAQTFLLITTTIYLIFFLMKKNGNNKKQNSKIK